MDAYERHTWTDEEINTRVVELNEKIARKQAELKTLEREITRSTATRVKLKELSVSVETLPHYYRDGAPQAVNADWHALLQAVHVAQDKTIKLEWK